MQTLIFPSRMLTLHSSLALPTQLRCYHLDWLPISGATAGPLCRLAPLPRNSSRSTRAKSSTTSPHNRDKGSQLIPPTSSRHHSRLPSVSLAKEASASFPLASAMPASMKTIPMRLNRASGKSLALAPRLTYPSPSSMARHTWRRTSIIHPPPQARYPPVDRAWPEMVPVGLQPRT